MTWDELRQEAFGEMGLNPDEFYDMDREDYWLKHTGFFNKRVYDQRVFRRMVMAIISPWVKQMPSPYNMMPLPNDDELRKQIKSFNDNRVLVISEKAMETLKRFKELQEKQKAKDN